ncbi:MAG TPA: sigma-70 family RNA polymerase sigma factor [Coleofasciculaceae cyanobacterium]
MQIPSFPECSHDLVNSLSHHSDQELLTLFQRHPDEGKYFTAIFCRYSPIVYSLIRHSVRSPVQADYLFAVTWRHIYYELGGLDLHQPPSADGKPFTLQSWLINITAVCINRMELPPVESIHYTLEEASPPLWCYVEQALDRLLPIHRLMVLMAQTFHWSETRIAAYLQAEGEILKPGEVKQRLHAAYQELEAALPQDISEIYLGRIYQSNSLEEDDYSDLFNLDSLQSVYD